MSQPSLTVVPPARFSEVEAEVARIDGDARAADGHPALGDQVWIDLKHPGPDSAGFLADDRAYAHVSRGENTGPAHWMLGLAIAPPARTDGTREALVGAAIMHVAAHGGGLVVLWLLGARDQDDVELDPTGLRPARDLYEMRVALPVAFTPKWPAAIEVRPFVVGADEAEWVEVNNRAFAGHAEQGGWTIDTLHRRMEEPWFDPTLFFLALDADGLAGFNWLKVHEPHARDRRLGEIYVIGVDPRTQGSGLGKALAIHGLHAVHARGIDTGMLFCAAENAPALKLYRALGFEVHRIDRAYECEVAPA